MIHVTLSKQQNKIKHMKFYTKKKHERQSTKRLGKNRATIIHIGEVCISWFTPPTFTHNNIQLTVLQNKLKNTRIRNEKRRKEANNHRNILVVTFGI